jgi:predicted nucleic acid-binding protein
MNIRVCSLDAADLQDVAILEKRRRLGKGELSSIAFAKKTRQAFMTDDRKAQRLGEAVLANQMTQSTPHLFGWLIFTGKLTDIDKDRVINEHQSLNRPLRKHFEDIYLEALRCRLMAGPPTIG